jgi:hypothetical protein
MVHQTLMQVLHSKFEEKWLLGTSGNVTMEQHISKQQAICQTALQIMTKTYTRVTHPKCIIRHNNMVQWYLGCHCTTKCWFNMVQWYLGCHCTTKCWLSH